MNLVFNARDAMPDGGELVIETANADLDEAFVQSHPGSQPGPHVILAVHDTGHGMAEDVLSHIFEPFFTTKDRTKGTGLGLATVYGTVRQSGGCITVSSKVGEGTTFQIYLPRVEAPVEVTEAPAAPPQPARGAETILVVEDDDAVRRMTREFLKIHGYTVIEARSAANAIQIMEAQDRSDRLGAHRCAHARNERPRTGRPSDFHAPGLESSLHVRLHRRRRDQHRCSEPGNRIHREALQPRRSGRKSSRRSDPHAYRLAVRIEGSKRASVICP